MTVLNAKFSFTKVFSIVLIRLYFVCLNFVSPPNLILNVHNEQQRFNQYSRDWFN